MHFSELHTKLLFPFLNFLSSIRIHPVALPGKTLRGAGTGNGGRRSCLKLSEELSWFSLPI